MPDPNFRINIELLRKGNRKAYEAVYFEYYDMLFHLALQYLNSTEQAKEIVQDAFMKLWENRSGLSQQSNIKNYLYTITKNCCLNYLRQRKVFSQYLNDTAYLEWEFRERAMSRLSDDQLQYEELLKKISTVLSQLPTELQQTFRMSREQELKYAEIAEKLNLSIKTVESRMSKVLRVLRLGLKDFL